MGAVPHDGGVTFRLWAPNARQVAVTGDFSGWDPASRSRLARDNSRALGDASDEFGGIGRNGALKTVEVANAKLQQPGAAYEYAPGKINNLDGSGGLITSHGDVENPVVTYAFASAVART